MLNKIGTGINLVKFLQKFTIFLAKKIGFIVIPVQSFDSFLLAKRLKRIIKEYQVDCFFDVGANVGQYRDFLREHVDYNGLIISFEPDPENFAKLRDRSKIDNKWIVLDYALGKERRFLDFNIMKSSVFNSFLEPDNAKIQEFERDNSVIKTIKIETKRLDELIKEIKNNYEFKNVFLKIDTQGFDLEVLAGASGCINQIRGIQTEVSVLPIYKNMPAFDASLHAFRLNGFEVSGLYSLSESRFPHAVEFDCIYLPKNCRKN